MSLLRMSSGKLFVCAAGLLFLSIGCIVPIVHATSVDDRHLSLVKDLPGQVIEESDQESSIADVDMTDASRRATGMTTYTICASVLEDKNNDKIGDIPIAGVLVELTTRAGVRVKGAYTDYNGKVSFASVSPGLYTLKQTTPAGYVAVSDSDGGEPRSEERRVGKECRP